ncbi:hypothetical protein PCASD_17169 [Puccinia coronata f. sp. avenae]|uniref:Uncharacterized protein n=1 Tax=Puccinia coronata f. sp. avenae TaxID=200324 RepID=A0A2N5SU76_9BASI|nr:hypothetical protein PCASD_17169 [Puccinia coronata f. sp. avenae]
MTALFQAPSDIGLDACGNRLVAIGSTCHNLALNISSSSDINSFSPAADIKSFPPASNPSDSLRPPAEMGFIKYAPEI